MESGTSDSDQSKTPQIKFNDLGRVITCSFYNKNQAPPSDLGKLTEFFLLWKEKWNNDRLPKRHHFSFEDFLGWHSHMRIIDIGGTIEDYKKNLIVGEVFAYYFGRSTLYEVIHSDNPPKIESVKHYDEYLTYIFDHHYCISFGTVTDENGFIHNFKWIDLPLSDDGKNISHIITALELEQK